MPDFAAARDRMVERQIAGRGIQDPLILEAFRAVPREAFVPEKLHEFAMTTRRSRSRPSRRYRSPISSP